MLNIKEMNTIPPIITQLAQFANRVMIREIENKNVYDFDTCAQIEGLANVYSHIYVTIYYGGVLRGCQRNKNEGAFDTKVKNAIQEALKDPRFKTADPIKNYQMVQIGITLVKHGEMQVQKLDDVFLGIHGITVKSKEREAFFKETVAVKYNYDPVGMLHALKKKAMISEGEQCQLWLHSVDTYLIHGTNVIKLFRGGYVIPMEDIGPGFVIRRLEMALNWLIQHFREGNWDYIYEPHTNFVKDGRNFVREIATTWMSFQTFKELEYYVKTLSLGGYFGKTYQKATDLCRVLKKSRVLQEEMTRIFTKDVGIGEVAFFLLCIISGDKDSPFVKERERVVELLKSRQLPDGSFMTMTKSASQDGVLFYPGEALYALATYGMEFPASNVIESIVLPALSYYRSFFCHQPHTAFVVWHIQAYTIVFKHFHQKEEPIREVVDFVFLMADWLVKQRKPTKWPDEFGCYAGEQGTFSSACYTEAMYAALEVAFHFGDEKRIKLYEQVFLEGVRYSLQLQVDEVLVIQYPNAQLSIGGMRTSNRDSTQRIDMTQHLIGVLLSALVYYVYMYPQLHTETAK